jgi:hypothetical protein
VTPCAWHAQHRRNRPHCHAPSSTGPCQARHAGRKQSYGTCTMLVLLRNQADGIHVCGQKLSGTCLAAPRQGVGFLLHSPACSHMILKQQAHVSTAPRQARRIRKQERVQQRARCVHKDADAVFIPRQHPPRTCTHSQGEILPHKQVSRIEATSLLQLQPSPATSQYACPHKTKRIMPQQQLSWLSATGLLTCNPIPPHPTMYARTRKREHACILTGKTSTSPAR